MYDIRYTEHMRIIGGKYRGRKIQFPLDRSVRPTKDRIRESVFNMIAEWLPGSRVLDLFAGSGAYGLEAVSRGATTAVFVDDNVRSIKLIQENARTLGIVEGIIALKEDVFSGIETLEKRKEKFNIVFSDPPYNKYLAKKTLITIDRCDILIRPGLLVLEHHKEECLPEDGLGLSILKKKTYKDISITVYVKK